MPSFDCLRSESRTIDLPVVLLLLVISLSVGCQQPLPTVTTVTGLVTLNDEPLPKVSVLFVPLDSKGFSGLTSFAITDENGRYNLTYSIPNPNDPASPMTGEGAMPGSYKVIVNDYHMISEMLPPPGRIPERYTDDGNPPLKFVIPVTPYELNIELEEP